MQLGEQQNQTDLWGEVLGEDSSDLLLKTTPEGADQPASHGKLQQPVEMKRWIIVRSNEVLCLQQNLIGKRTNESQTKIYIFSSLIERVKRGLQKSKTLNANLSGSW